jgi:hypothetical protein
LLEKNESGGAATISSTHSTKATRLDYGIKHAPRKDRTRYTVLCRKTSSTIHACVSGIGVDVGGNATGLLREKYSKSNDSTR